MEKTLCEACKDREHCQTACRAVNKILFKDNGVFERHFSDRIEVYPQNGRREIHFSAIEPERLEKIPGTATFPWETGGLQFKHSSVFVDHFINKMPYKECSDKYNVTEAAARSIYLQAASRVQTVVKELDTRRKGLQAVDEKFTEEQKFFLLVYIFGFTKGEVAKIFGKYRTTVSIKIARMADKYADAFAGLEVKGAEKVSLSR